MRRQSLRRIVVRSESPSAGPLGIRLWGSRSGLRTATWGTHVVKPHEMVAQKQGSRASCCPLDGWNEFRSATTVAELAWALPEMSQRPPFAFGDYQGLFCEGDRRRTNRNLYSRSSGNACRKLFMTTQHSGHSRWCHALFAATIHHDGASPCCLRESSPPALHLARHRLTMAKPSA